ncbi:hypothetical protein DNL40_11980 [Xylanimonas oleitrophica]|uniref:Uncharacterized protein n=1 Tax=Xylanimonas oleitrophica TaxID=2607479 RepID=A0A2W5XRQ3_9MICO|nr:hypothetical protein [Xylanimonas oleitrophica]PZR52388.1 hypothetical protein DNL40_11980 [Xylanimonas oleitrophica]
MASIKLNPAADHEQVIDRVRETFEARDYHWQEVEPGRATASEGGRPVKTSAIPVSQRLRVAVQLDPGSDTLHLTRETLGAAYAAGTPGGGFFFVRLGQRFRKMVKATREDLAAAGLAA